MMLDRAMAFLVLLILGGFLGILVWNVPRWDLAAVVAATMLLALWDFLRTAGRNGSG